MWSLWPQMVQGTGWASEIISSVLLQLTLVSWFGKRNYMVTQLRGSQEEFHQGSYRMASAFENKCHAVVL